jgi:hypothetical protein
MPASLAGILLEAAKAASLKRHRVMPGWYRRSRNVRLFGMAYAESRWAQARYGRGTRTADGTADAPKTA